MENSYAFYAYFKEHVKAEISKYDCENTSLLRKLGISKETDNVEKRLGVAPDISFPADFDDIDLPEKNAYMSEFTKPLDEYLTALRQSRAGLNFFAK